MARPGFNGKCDYIIWVKPTHRPRSKDLELFGLFLLLVFRLLLFLGRYVRFDSVGFYWTWLLLSQVKKFMTLMATTYLVGGGVPQGAGTLLILVE